MSIPANFPGRVNDRRISALARIERQMTDGVKHNHGRAYPLDADDEKRLNAQANALALRIVQPSQARAVRTKKNRTGTGALSRAS